MSGTRELATSYMMSGLSWSRPGETYGQIAVRHWDFFRRIRPLHPGFETWHPTGIHPDLFAPTDHIVWTEELSRRLTGAVEGFTDRRPGECDPEPLVESEWWCGDLAAGLTLRFFRSSFRPIPEDNWFEADFPTMVADESFSTFTPELRAESMSYFTPELTQSFFRIAVECWRPYWAAFVSSEQLARYGLLAITDEQAYEAFPGHLTYLTGVGPAEVADLADVEPLADGVLLRVGAAPDTVDPAAPAALRTALLDRLGTLSYTEAGALAH